MWVENKTGQKLKRHTSGQQIEICFGAKKEKYVHNQCPHCHPCIEGTHIKIHTPHNNKKSHRGPCALHIMKCNTLSFKRHMKLIT